MVLRLGATLDVPLRDQNELLRGAGFPPEFAESGAEADLPKEIARAIERMLAQHEPFPMTVMDRHYDVVRINRGATSLMSRFVRDPSALGARPNVFHMLFDPRLSRSFVVEWPRVAHAMVARLHRETLAHPEDPGLAALLRSLFEHPDVPESWRQPDFSAPSEATLTFRLQRDDLALAFLTTLTVFNAPQNVTLEELRIESWFPLDDATTRACERLVE
jgi:hypothetical protein